MSRKTVIAVGCIKARCITMRTAARSWRLNEFADLASQPSAQVLGFSAATRGEVGSFDKDSAK